MGRTRPQIEKMWNYEEKILAEYSNIIDLLVRKENLWIIQNGQILFTNVNDLELFNRYITIILNYAKLQQEGQRQRVEETQKIFTILREALQ